LIDELLEQKYTNITATDISEVALDLLKDRLEDEASSVKFIIDDLTNPTLLKDVNSFDLWIERAVFHFFTESKDQDTYVNLLTDKVKKGGHLILATFSLHGASKCSGLPVRKYSKLMLTEKLKEGFELVEHFEHLYTMPSGDTRPYLYTLFKRI